MEEIPTLAWLLSSLKLIPREQLKKSSLDLEWYKLSVKAASFAFPSSAKPTLRTQSEWRLLLRCLVRRQRIKWRVHFILLWNQCRIPRQGGCNHLMHDDSTEDWLGHDVENTSATAPTTTQTTILGFLSSWLHFVSSLLTRVVYLNFFCGILQVHFAQFTQQLLQKRAVQQSTS